MDRIESRQVTVDKILSTIDLGGVFALSKLEGMESNSFFELITNQMQKPFKIQGCYPLFFSSEENNLILVSDEVARKFFDFENIDLKNIKIKQINVNVENSTLLIHTTAFSLTLFPNEMWGWGIQFEGENYMIEALEFGGVEVR